MPEKKSSAGAFHDLMVFWKIRPFLCLGVAFVLLLPSVFLLIWDTRGNADMESQAAHLQSELVDARGDRDAKAAQLAPFAAAADRWFENAPPEKRLGLLLERVDLLAQVLKNSAAPQAGKRSLSWEAVNRVKARLGFAPRIPITVCTPPDDAEASALAVQIAALFQDSGFRVREVSQDAADQRGIVIRSKRDPDGALANGILQLSAELGVRPTVALVETMPEQEVAITVGSK